jgi:crotonobetainyl-CoA:carnitine CoA-transferase CaiB-like acyl-CoA transferase
MAEENKVVVAPESEERDSELALSGLKVIELATHFAAPLTGMLLGDFGAEVIKVEHPRGDSIRHLGWSANGVSLWWKLLARNKKCVTLDLSKEKGQEILRRLVADADVLIENFRPGTLERWNVGYDDLRVVNPRLIMVRTTGFGQTGPYKDRPGFGTLAEAITGFAHRNGYPEGPPTLPPTALADSIAGLAGTFAVMFAIYHRDVKGKDKGQVIDLSLFEPMFAILGPQAAIYDQLGIIPTRLGNRSTLTSPRNVFQTKDGAWVSLSASSQSIAERTMAAIGRDDLFLDPRFADNESRLKNIDALDSILADWFSRKTRDEAIAEFEKHQAALAPIYDISDIVNDPQYQARETITSVEDPDLGELRLQNVFPILSETPGKIRHAGPSLGESNYEIYRGRLGYGEEELEQLREAGVI